MKRSGSNGWQKWSLVIQIWFNFKARIFFSFLLFRCILFSHTLNSQILKHKKWLGFFFNIENNPENYANFSQVVHIFPLVKMKYSLRYLEYEVAAVDRGSIASSTKVPSQPACFEFIKQGKNDLAQYPSGKTSIYSYSISGMGQDPKMRVKRRWRREKNSNTNSLFQYKWQQ